MHHQVGDLVINEKGMAQQGLLVRHLVMPGEVAGTQKCLEFLAQEISSNSYVNIMDQYHPSGDLKKYPELNQRVTLPEYALVIHQAKAAGLQRLDKK